MNFIRHRSLLDKKIDDLIESSERVFNETLQDMLQAAVANFTGKDNSDGPILPKTPSTCRRLRTRQQKKRKQQIDGSHNDGSPQLSKTLRPLDNISNTMENTDNQVIGTVRKSSRKCAIKATQAISELTGRKKGSSYCADRQEQEVKEISSSVTDDDEATCYNEEATCYNEEPMQLDQTFTSHDEKSTAPIDQSLTPLVINDVHPVSPPITQMETDSGCLNETKTLSVLPEDFSSSDEDKYSTPPNDVSTGVANKESKPSGDIRRVTTIIKICPEPADQVIVNNGSCVDLALLTKLTPQAKKSVDAGQTPATVIKDCFNENHVNISSSTVIKDHPTSSRTVVETPATIIKVPSDSDDACNAEEQNDGSPELAVLRKPQVCQVATSCTVSSASAAFSTTKKQTTPNNAFSPAKLKSTVPIEPSGLLCSNHAPSKTGLGGIKKLTHKEQQMQKAKERLAEKNRRDKERLQLLEKKKEQERLEKKRRNEDQLRKVQERQALLLKKKEAQKIQMQQKTLVMELPEEVKVTEKPYSEMQDQGRKLREEFHATPIWESDEENYWEEEKRKRDNCTSHEDYNFYVEKEVEKANLAKTRMCSVDKIPTTISNEAIPQLTNLFTNHDNGVDDNDGDYGIGDLHSDDSTDEEDSPRKPIPPWAQENNLTSTIERQEDRPLNASMAVFSRETDPVNLGRIFKNKKQRFFKRTSSAQWSSPPTKANDWIV